jgi:hypothetical protein
MATFYLIGLPVASSIGMRWTVLLVAGCSAGVAAPQPLPETHLTSAAIMDEAAVADLTDARPHHAFGGVTTFVAQGAERIGRSADERALIDASHVAEQGEDALRTILADGVAAGRVDDAKVEAAIDRLRVDASTAYDLSEEALDHLHATTTPQERAALAEDLWARWTGWLQSNPVDEASRPRGQLQSVANAMGLTPDQLSAVRLRFDELMKETPPLDASTVSGRLRAFAVAFARGDFDAHLVPQASVGPDLVGWTATRQARLCEALAEVATPEQRSKLAVLLRAHVTTR